MSKPSKQAVQSQKKLAEESLKGVLVFSTYESWCEFEIDHCVIVICCKLDFFLS